MGIAVTRIPRTTVHYVLAVDQNQELPRRVSQTGSACPDATSEVCATHCASKARVLERYRVESSAFPIFSFNRLQGTDLGPRSVYS
jgi:hypothetical protein